MDQDVKTEETIAEEALFRVKQLEIKFYDFETENKMTDCCLSEFDEELYEDRVNLEKLEKRVTQLETDLESVSEPFDERVATLKLQNVELRNHLNLVVDMVNNITNVLNKTFNPGEAVDNTQSNNEPTDEAIVVDDDDEPEDKEPTQPTLQQVYDMYQSQPQDEEGWQEMTNAIKTAEEYEASLPIRTNGLTQEEWDDLLRI